MIASISWITGMGKMGVSAYPSVYIRLVQEPLLQRVRIGVLGQGWWVWAGVEAAGGADAGEGLSEWQELLAPMSAGL